MEISTVELYSYPFSAAAKRSESGSCARTYCAPSRSAVRIARSWAHDEYIREYDIYIYIYDTKAPSAMVNKATKGGDEVAYPFLPDSGTVQWGSLDPDLFVLRRRQMVEDQTARNRVLRRDC